MKYPIEVGCGAVDGVRRPDFDCDGFTRNCLRRQNEMKGRLLLDVVVRKSATVFELLAGKVRRSVARQEDPPCPVSSAWLDIESSTLK